MDIIFLLFNISAAISQTGETFVPSKFKFYFQISPSVTLQIPDSHFEKKNFFEYFFICHYIKTVWLAENLNEIKITHYEKIFSYIKQEFSHFGKGLVINDIFVVSLRLPLFSPRYITLKRNQKIISKTI